MFLRCNQIKTKKKYSPFGSGKQLHLLVNSRHNTQISRKQLRHVLRGRPLNFQGLMREGWVIRLSMNFIYFWTHNAQDISFSSCMISFSCYAGMYFFCLKAAWINFFVTITPPHSPPTEHFAWLEQPTIQPEDHLASQLHRSDISMSSQKAVLES